MSKKNFVTYEDFGAVGDGKTCDLEAIVKAHNFANENGLPVITKPGATYYIGDKNLTATIKTNTNFGTSRFIIDDRNLENINSQIFHVASDFKEYNPNLTSLQKGQKKIEFEHEGKRTYLRVFNDNEKIFIRKGVNANAGSPKSDCIVVDEFGNVETSIDWEYKTITKQFAKCIDDEPILVEGGIFTTIANNHERVYKYHKRGFVINRSNVTVKNITHYIEQEGDDGAPYSGFLSVSECCDVTIRDCLLTPHKTYLTKDSVIGVKINNMGTYDLNFSASVRTSLINVQQTRDILDKRYWGLMGSNFCKELLLEDCEVSRFDAHQGVSSATIRRCKLGHQCLNLIGFGDFVIEDSFALGGSFINLRGDYGSHWDGTVKVKNCIWRPRNTSNEVIINAFNEGDHDFGYTATMPSSIEIDGLVIEDDINVDENVPLYILPTYDGNYEDGKPFAYGTTKSLKVRGIKSNKNKVATVCKDERMYKGLCKEVEL